MDGDPSGPADELTSSPAPRPRWWLARRIGIGTAVVVAVVYLWAEWRHRPQDRAAFFDPAAFGDRPLVVAHQGGELLRPSNTMEAFEHAVSLGADVLDTDLHRSAGTGTGASASSPSTSCSTGSGRRFVTGSRSSRPGH